jgi:chemotaxis protein methyltransferase CheR
MSDALCVEFLQWALPQLRKRWKGFHNVRKQVCKRLGRRVRELELEDLREYRGYLEQHPEEWSHLDFLCRVTISSFYRNQGVFDRLSRELLPDLVRLVQQRGDSALRVWSAGCGAGEEAYTVSILCQTHPVPLVSDMPIEIIGTDYDHHQIERAHQAIYPRGSTRSVPSELLSAGFEESGDELRVREAFRRSVDIRREDIREKLPGGPFHLILCRNFVFTYFDAELQCELGEEIIKRLVPGGVLVLGKHEVLPPALDLEVESEHNRLFRAR